MRIRSLHVAGFGKFADFRRGPFERPATIFHGANEAGKSTLLAFIRRVLLGFPDGRSRRNPYPPLAGGRHGGNITLVSDAGDAVTVERYQGSRGGPVTLTSVSGEPIAAAALPKLLAGHSRHIFESLFAFTLDELHDEALLKDESVNSQLYSAGMGAARLPHARRTLDERKRRLFLKGGSKHALHIAANSLDAVVAKLRDVRDNAATYGRLSARLRDVESELARLNDDRKAERGRLDRANQLGSAWDDWIAFNSASAELAELPALKDFPADGARRLDALEEALQTTQKERDDARDETRQARALAEAAIEHESLLVREDVIRDLERRRTAFDNAVADLPKRQADLAQCDGRLAATLKDLGSDWDAIAWRRSISPWPSAKTLPAIRKACARVTPMCVAANLIWNRRKRRSQRRTRRWPRPNRTSTLPSNPHSVNRKSTSEGRSCARRGPRLPKRTLPASEFRICSFN